MNGGKIMKLYDYVNKRIEDNEIFNIGNNGSGWIFIGNKKEFNSLIKLISEDYKNKYERRLTNSEKSIEATEIKGRKRGNIFVKGQKISEPEDIWKARILKSISELENIVEHKFSTYFKNKEKFLSFVPFEEREVTKVYYTDISKTKCIRIEGQDTGAFWTLEEFSKIYKNGKRTTNKMDWFRNDDEEDEEEES